jgi:hypothetical protein
MRPDPSIANLQRLDSQSFSGLCSASRASDCGAGVNRQAPAVKEVTMFAGHIGVALALARAERRVNPGVFIVAALLLDLILWSFVLLGWESVAIPANFAGTHQPEFVFPYSHGLLAAVGWSLLAATASVAWSWSFKAARLRIAMFMGMAVFSHWLLDALVHGPEMPLLGENSSKIGLGLWNSMAAALFVEALVTLAGLWLFVSSANLSCVNKAALVVFTSITLVFTIVGMTVAPPAPSVVAMALSSLVTIIVVCALAGWLGKPAT